MLLFARTTSGERSGGVVLTQGLMLAIGGGVIGAVLTWLGLPALRTLTPGMIPRLDEVTFAPRVVVFSVVLCVLAGLVIGVVPAWRASRPDTTRESGGPRDRASRGWLSGILLVTLLAVQAALAFVLLAGAGLAIRGYVGLRDQDVGIDPSGLLSVDVHLPRDPYVTPDVAKAGSIEIAEYNPAGPALYDRIRAALQTMPGVVEAAGVGTEPFAAAPFVQALDRGPGARPLEPGRRPVPGRHGQLLQDDGDSHPRGAGLLVNRSGRLALGRSGERGDGPGTLARRRSHRTAADVHLLSERRRACARGRRSRGRHAPLQGRIQGRSADLRAAPATGGPGARLVRGPTHGDVVRGPHGGRSTRTRRGRPGAHRQGRRDDAGDVDPHGRVVRQWRPGQAAAVCRHDSRHLRDRPADHERRRNCTAPHRSGWRGAVPR